MEDTRLDKLEKEVAELKEKYKIPSDKPKKEKKPREPREPSKYNLFMKDQMAILKKEQGDSYNHQKAFKETAVAWSSSKNKK